MHDRLTAWPGAFRDDNAHLIGFWGLTITDIPPHRYRVDHVTLSTWCAWDTLFLTPILARTARVESLDAETSEPVALTVTPDGVTDPSHPELLLSFLDPTGRVDANVIESFCHDVHWFTTRNNGERWCAQHPGTFLLELDDAVTLGRGYADALLSPTGQPTI